MPASIFVFSLGTLSDRPDVMISMQATLAYHIQYKSHPRFFVAFVATSIRRNSRIAQQSGPNAKQTIYFSMVLPIQVPLRS